MIVRRPDVKPYNVMCFAQLEVGKAALLCVGSSGNHIPNAEQALVVKMTGNGGPYMVNLNSNLVIPEAALSREMRYRYVTVDIVVEE